MVVTVGEGIQRIQSLYSRGVQSISSRLTARHIYSALTSARSTILRQQFNKNQFISSWSYQTLPCVELIKAPISECPCAPRAGCVILRSKYPLPKSVTGISKSMIKSVTSLDGSQIYVETSFESNKYSGKGDKYTNTKPSYYIRSGFLYIIGVTELKAITITALFEDPVEAASYASVCEECPDCACKDVMEQDFFIDREQLTGIVQIASQEVIGIMKQMQEDRNNNAADDTGATNIVHQGQQQNDQQ